MVAVLPGRAGPERVGVRSDSRTGVKCVIDRIAKGEPVGCAGKVSRVSSSGCAAKRIGASLPGGFVTKRRGGGSGGGAAERRSDGEPAERGAARTDCSRHFDQFN